MVNWRAVAYGFIATVVVGIISGASVPFTNMSLPIVGWGLTGIIGGFVAGYMASGTLGNGAVHGLLATVIGALVAVVLVALLGIATFSMGALIADALLLVAVLAAGIPGIVGGALGSWAKARGEVRETRAAPR